MRLQTDGGRDGQMDGEGWMEGQMDGWMINHIKSPSICYFTKAIRTTFI